MNPAPRRPLRYRPSTEAGIEAITCPHRSALAVAFGEPAICSSCRERDIDTIPQHLIDAEQDPAARRAARR